MDTLFQQKQKLMNLMEAQDLAIRFVKGAISLYRAEQEHLHEDDKKNRLKYEKTINVLQGRFATLDKMAGVMLDMQNLMREMGK